MPELLKYQIESCAEQARKIVEEYPKVKFVHFEIPDCKYEEAKETAKHYGKTLQILSGVGEAFICIGAAAVQIKTKRLIVSEPVIVEG